MEPTQITIPTPFQIAEMKASSTNFFELVRFDFNLDEHLNPFVMEVNMSPNLTPAHERFADNAMFYEQVIYNAVKMIGGGSYQEFMTR
jgi:D-alanine-D-alanine ligase-like ATP-grasp enzyme